MMSLKDKVKYILEKIPSARLDDLMLIIEIWKLEGLELTEKQEKRILISCSKPASIRRIRQNFQRYNLLLPLAKDIIGQKEKKKIRN